MFVFVLKPLAPSSLRPDMAQMRIITESELHRGAVIGSGAFGTVYKVCESVSNLHVYKTSCRHYLQQDAALMGV